MKCQSRYSELAEMFCALNIGYISHQHMIGVFLLVCYLMFMFSVVRVVSGMCRQPVWAVVTLLVTLHCLQGMSV